MRITRHKSFKKSLRFFKAAFDYVDPFHVIIDTSFIETSVTEKVTLKDDLSTLLAGRVTPMVTSCVMCHLRKNGRKNPAALMVGKSCFRLKCQHDEKNPLSAADCMASQLGKDNVRHFFVATQDDGLKRRARQIPGTPVMCMHGNMLMIESPSDESRAAAQHMEQKRRLPKLSEQADEDSSDEETVEGSGVKKRKRRQKGANPLSCRPRKIKDSNTVAGDEPVKKRTRSKRTPRADTKIDSS